MADTGKRGLLSFGVFLIIVVVSIFLYASLKVIGWTLILPLILMFSGFWLAVLAGIRFSSPLKYERGPFSTLSWGLLLVALGGAWFAYGFGWFYSLIIILLVFAVLAIATALKRK